MSDKHDFKSNLDATGTDDKASENSGGLFGGINKLTQAAHDAAEEANRPRTFADSLKGLADAAQEAAKQADKTTMGGSAFGGVADAAAAAQAAAEAARKQQEQAQAQQQAQPDFQSGGVVEEEEFVGSGGVGSSDQLDAIRRGYAERGMADPSGMGGPNEATFQSNLDATSGGPEDTNITATLDSSDTNDTNDDDFQGSGGVSSDMLDAIRKAYQERGMDDPSGSNKPE